MGTDQETQRDLSLDADAAEEVVGGRSVKHHSKKTARHLKTLPQPYGQAPSTPPGLFMGPDPNYPDPNTDTGDPDYY
jgi:hypothetical protein